MRWRFTTPYEELNHKRRKTIEQFTGIQEREVRNSPNHHGERQNALLRVGRSDSSWLCEAEKCNHNALPVRPETGRTPPAVTGQDNRNDFHPRGRYLPPRRQVADSRCRRGNETFRGLPCRNKLLTELDELKSKTHMEGSK
nr:MAG TPA: hypothetical protein [Caudoviricetes sp.]